jgi:hypothetical protein
LESLPYLQLLLVKGNILPEYQQEYGVCFDEDLQVDVGSERTVTGASLKGPWQRLKP